MKGGFTIIFDIILSELFPKFVSRDILLTAFLLFNIFPAQAQNNPMPALLFTFKLDNDPVV